MVWDVIWNRGQFRAELYPEFAWIEQQNFREALDKRVFGGISRRFQEMIRNRNSLGS
jgi:hypothetical protein